MDALPSELLQLSTLLILSRSTQFSHSRQTPLQVLSHLVQQYIQTLATTSNHLAQQSGRSHVSIWDLGEAIEEFGVGGLNGLRDELESTKDQDDEAVDDLRLLASSLQGMADQLFMIDLIRIKLTFH